MSSVKLYSYFFIDGNITGESYLTMLNHCFVLLTNNLSVPTDYLGAVRVFLNRKVLTKSMASEGKNSDELPDI